MVKEQRDKEGGVEHAYQKGDNVNDWYKQGKGIIVTTVKDAAVGYIMKR